MKKLILLCMVAVVGCCSGCCLTVYDRRPLLVGPLPPVHSNVPQIWTVPPQTTIEPPR